MTEPLERLFTPLSLRSLTLRNRIVFLQHGNGLANSEFLPTERQARYLAERAKGGAALVILGASMVMFNAMSFFGRNLISDRRSMPGLKRIAEMVHAHGAKMFGQLSHQGRQTTSQISRLPVWAPSPVPCVINREVPKELEREDMEEVIEGFVQGARNEKEAGFDGVEVYAAHGYLLSQFLSPHSNRRKDVYGGSLENRLRFPLEVIEAVRKEVGERLVVGFRMNGDDLTAGGLSPEDLKEIAVRVAGTGWIDYISVSAGTYNSIPRWLSDMTSPQGPLVHLASGIKGAIRLPVLCANRINDPIQGEKILAGGHADLIGMCRALVCDPELPNKAREGRVEEIRTCIACSQGCLQRTFKGLPISCIYNPTVGYEKKWGIGTLKSAGRKKSVMIAGGGPAGMEAARVTALRGHRVTLYEKDQDVGGQIRLVSKLPERKEFGKITNYLRHQLERLGVEMRLGVEVTLDLVREVGPDVLIIAAGSEPDRTGFTPVRPETEILPGVDQENVLTVRDILEGKRRVGDRVVILDWESDLHASGTAQFLAEQGKKVEIVTYLPYTGVDIVSPTFGPLYQNLFKLGVGFIPFSTAKEIRGTTLTVFNVYSKEERRIEGVDTIVLSTGSKANSVLYEQVEKALPSQELHAVGDCVSPRRILDAVYDGHRIGRSI